MAITVTQLNAYIDSIVTTRQAIMDSMVDTYSASETNFKHLRVKELTEEINAAEAKVRRLQQTTRRFRGIRFYPVK